MSLLTHLKKLRTEIAEHLLDANTYQNITVKNYSVKLHDSIDLLSTINKDISLIEAMDKNGVVPNEKLLELEMMWEKALQYYKDLQKKQEDDRVAFDQNYLRANQDSLDMFNGIKPLPGGSLEQKSETMRMLNGRKDQICRKIAYANTADEVILLSNDLKSCNDAICNIYDDLRLIEANAVDESSTETKVE